MAAVVAASMAPALGCGGQIGDTTSTGSGGVGSTGGTGGGSAASDLPCDVAALLSAKCVSCHGAIPAPGVPMSLVTYANLTAPAASDRTKTVAVVAVSRMMDTTNPMPPLGLPAATTAEVASLQSWIAAGYPKTGCSSGLPPDPFSVAPTCTSATTWTGGTEGSASMEPGMACISCHSSSRGEAPIFTIAGTLYPTAHEPDLCNGAAGTAGAMVVVTDATGKSVSITPNSAGNFSYAGALATPFHAKVTYMGRERAMATGQTSGDCNGCHTQNGTMSAPGRIILP